MQQAATPDHIFQIASGFMASKHLFVATEIGLFEHISDSGSTLDDLSASSKVPRRTLRMFVDAMVALRLLEGRDLVAADRMASGRSTAPRRAVESAGRGNRVIRGYGLSSAPSFGDAT
jgi:Dimerisation domain